MSNICTYDLSADNAIELLDALKGNEDNRAKWIDKLQTWINYRDLKLKIYDLAKQWFTEHGKRTGCYKGHHEEDSDEDQLRDWVWYQMEFVGGLEWAANTKTVIINKYSSSRPLLKADDTQELLDFVTKELNSDMACLPGRC